MNFRWLLFDYADPALPLSFWKRQKLFWGIYPVWKLPKPLRRGALMRRYIILTPILITPLFIPLVISLIGTSNSWLSYSLTVIPFLIFSWIWMSITYGLNSLSEHYYRIRREGYDLCLSCGYWLRGLDETIKTCPECGTDRIAFDEDDHLKARS